VSGRSVAPALLVALGATIVCASSARAIPQEERTQFVIVSLDTTPSGRRPIESTDFHRLLRAMNRRADRPQHRFTVFVASGGLTLDPRTRASDATHPYFGVLPRNRPVMRYATDLPHLRARAAAVRRMADLGIEIGSHAVRHEHGRAWSRARWALELAEHDRIAERLGLPAARGFRAPFLEHNEDMYDVLSERGYRYDVSRTGNAASWPTRHRATGLWLFHIPTVRVAGRSEPVLLFDDNLHHVLTHPARASGSVDDAFLAAVREGFERRYRGARAPFLISGHGRFITPITRFLRDVCDQPDVRCATFAQATDYLEAHPELEGASE
jgi:peptidoglycan/xylan/chitin deacetylase (PgdA/CDA1 family)